MLLAVDIGNSHIKFGIFDCEHLISKFSLPINRDLSLDDLRQAIGQNLDIPISGAILCSVVPDTETVLAEFLNREFEVQPILVRNDFGFGLKINYQPLSAAGTDRLVNSFAAAEKYGVPFIVCSFGTATTIDVVNADRVFLGGTIAPGMKLMSKALELYTARLPETEIEKPETVLGNTTVTSIQSGIFYGHLGMVEGIIQRIKNEIGDSPKVIASGGFASLIAVNTAQIDIVDENLTLDGLRLFYDRR